MPNCLIALSLLNSNLNIFGQSFKSEIFETLSSNCDNNDKDTFLYTQNDDYTVDSSASEDENNCFENMESDYNMNPEISASIGFSSPLYDPFTFEKLSDNHWGKFSFSMSLPITKNTTISLLENLFYTPENDNPTCENNTTDLVVSQNICKDISVDLWFELSQYLNQKNSSTFNTFLSVNYIPITNLSVSSVFYKPLWNNSDFYILNAATYKTLSNKEILLNTITSCSENLKTQVWVGVRFPIWDKIDFEVRSIPDASSWIVPSWLLFVYTYNYSF